MMKNAIKRIDLKLFRLSERFILKMVGNGTHKEHKYDVFYKFKSRWLGVFMFIVYVVMPPLFLFKFGNTAESGVVIGINLLVWTLILPLQFMELKMIKNLGDQYSVFFQNRKNPIVYQAVKELCANMFEEGKAKRCRNIVIRLISAIVLILVGSSNPLPSIMTFVVLFQLVIFFFDDYVPCIFDFDPPEEKERKVEESEITNLMRDQWQRLIGALRPGSSTA